MTGHRIGVGICGSFCTFSQILPVLKTLSCSNEVTAVLSYSTQEIDTRFYRADDFKRDVINVTGRAPITTISGAEQVGPQHLFDVMLIAPCTGNTMAKLRYGITDTPVLMAAKAHLRNNKPLVIGFSTNDALGAAAPNWGELLNRRNIYFVPFSQDDYDKKPRSMAAHFGLCEKALEAALRGEQLQPIIG
ncbi:MAG: dipicolinate synthase subunit B [Clostridia bacterium]|nr:dipicolinate synthase subunit B [Clostridia bacterium]